MRDCAAEALPAAETAEAEQGQRSAFCKRAASRAAKTGHRNQGWRGQRPRLRGTSPSAPLGYANPRDALAKHVDPEDKRQDDGVAIYDPIGREQHPTIINESGLYSLVLPVRPSPARRGAYAPRRAVLPRTRGRRSYALLTRPTPL